MHSQAKRLAQAEPAGIMLGLGLATIGLVVSDLFQPVNPTGGDRIIRILVEDAPAAVFLFAVGAFSSFALREFEEHRSDYNPRIFLVISSVLTTILSSSMQGYFHNGYPNGLPLLNHLPAAMLLLAIVLNWKRRWLLALTLFFLFASATVTAFFTLPPPLGSPLPMLSYLTFPLLGVLIEHVVYDSIFWQSLLTMAGLTAQMLGISSVVMANSDGADFNQAMYTPLDQFISGAAHSGGLLNTLGNWGHCIAVVPGAIMLSQSAKLRKLFIPISAVGLCSVTARCVHIVAMWFMFPPSPTPSNPFPDTASLFASVVGENRNLIYSDLGITIALSMVCAFVLGAGPVEKVLIEASKAVRLRREAKKA